MDKINKITCHQYTTGRGPSGYDFVEYSRDSENKGKATFQFPLMNGVGLRFSQLTNPDTCIYEIEPAGTDYQHLAAFMTRNREEGGSISLYTHALITDETKAVPVLGLLRKENFLTPEQFSQLTHGEFQLRKEEKVSTCPTVQFTLSDEQKRTLKAFLARYWALLESREFGYREKAEIALILPNMTQEEQISFFQQEVVSRLPENVQCAVSVSFGATWENKGARPAVCLVLNNMEGRPFPAYNPYNLNNSREDFKRPGPVEEQIGDILIGNSGMPKIYQRLNELAEKNKSLRMMARGYSTMAFSVQAEQAVQYQNRDQMLEIHQKILDMAVNKYKVPEVMARRLLLPLARSILYYYLDHKKYKEGIQYHASLYIDGLTKEDLQEIDNQVIKALEDLPSMNDSLGESVFEQVCQLRGDKKQSDALQLAERYLSLLQEDKNRSVLYRIIQSNAKWISEDFELTEKLLDWCGKHIDNGGEKAILAFLNLLQAYEKENPEQTEKIKEKTLRQLFEKTSKLQTISESTLKSVQEYALTQPIRADTLESMFDLALNHMNYEFSQKLLNTLLKKATASGAVSSDQLRTLIYQKLEQTANQDGMQESAKEGMRQILAQNKNAVPDGKYIIWQQVRKERIQQELKRFFENTNSVRPQALHELWESKSEKEMSCSWDQIQDEWIETPMNLCIERLYKQTSDPLSYLEELSQYAKGETENPITEIYRSSYVRLLDEHYDVLWRKNDKDRERLEKMFKEIEEKGAPDDLRKAKESIAYRAGEYEKRLQELCEKGLMQNPEALGELINQLIKENGFEQCISFEKKRYKQQEGDTLFDLGLSLIGEISLQKEHNPAYWDQVLRDLGFEAAQEPWKAENLRSINCLSFVIETLSRMKAITLQRDLKQYLGKEYLKRLWNPNIQKKKFFDKGERILSKTFYEWITNT